MIKQQPWLVSVNVDGCFDIDWVFAMRDDVTLGAKWTIELQFFFFDKQTK